jgi:ABC-2 type transport system permease protein
MNVIHKYWQTILMTGLRTLEGEWWSLPGRYSLRFLRVLFLLSLWHTLLPPESATSGMTLHAVLTYTLIAEVFASQLSSRAALDTSLWQGDIANRFLRPMSIYGQYTAEMIGDWLLDLALFSLPLILIAPLFGVNPLPASPMAALLFAISLTLGVAVGLALDFIFTAMMVFLEHSIYALMQIRNAISVLLSGAILPLALLPWGLGDIFTYLPFASLASAPLRIYTGTGDPQFGYNIMHISRRIGRGQLDHILIQPQPIWIALLTEGFVPFSGSWSFLTGVGVTFWALTQIELSITFIWCLYFALNLLSSCAVVLGFSYLWGSLAFWAP